MMVDNELGSLANPVIAVASRTNDMTNFPDTSLCGSDKVMDIFGSTFVVFGDKNGYILFGHDRLADGSSNTNLVNYVVTSNATYWYTVDSVGTVTQYDTGP
jgi:hypothetical protein